MTDPLVVFTPSGKRGHFPVGTPILDAARSLGVYVESVCGGRGICGRCQVEPMVGSFAKHKIESRAENVSDWSSERGSLHRQARQPEGRSPAFLLHHHSRPPRRRYSRRRCRAAADHPQGGQPARNPPQSGDQAVLCRGRRARHAQASRRSRPVESRTGRGMGLRRYSGRPAHFADMSRKHFARATGPSPPPSTRTWSPRGLRSWRCIRA